MHGIQIATVVVVKRVRYKKKKHGLISMWITVENKRGSRQNKAVTAFSPGILAIYRAVQEERKRGKKR